MNVFISMSMAGLTSDEIQVKFDKLSKRVKQLHPYHNVINSIVHLNQEHLHNGSAYAGESLKLMANANLVMMPNDFVHHRGCRLEYAAAVLYGVPVEFYTP